MRFAEFFAGIGLVRLGLEKSGWECVFANDFDPKKLEMYGTQFPDAQPHFHLGDIRCLGAKDLPEFDLATASFPCTDLSLAGGRAGLAGQHSSAIWPFLKLQNELGEKRPKLILLENVPALLTSRGGEDLKSTLASLNELGYAVDLLVLDAVNFVPQSRPRLFIVAIRSGKPSKLQDAKSVVRPIAVASFIRSNPELNWSIRNLPDPPIPAKGLAQILELLPEIAPEWWSQERSEYLFSQMSPKHQALAESMTDGDTDQVGTVFRRVRQGKTMAELRSDGIAGCLRTPKGGSARQILMVAGNGRRRFRLLTPRECSRLMGAGDYKLEVSLQKALFGFGDAVCVPAIDWIARNYLNPVLEELNLNTALPN